MWVTKYSWKQRRWRAGGATACGCAERAFGARLQPRQAVAGLRDAVERRTDGFHMLSLAAEDALCCKRGNYVMVRDRAKTWCWRRRPDVPRFPSFGSCTCEVPVHCQTILNQQCTPAVNLVSLQDGHSQYGQICMRLYGKFVLY